MELSANVSIMNNDQQCIMTNKLCNTAKFSNNCASKTVNVASVLDDFRGEKGLSNVHKMLVQESLNRIEETERMNSDIELLVRDCLSLRHQHDALTDANRHLKSEKREMLRTYEDLLKKTQHDTNIIFKLQNSEENFKAEIHEMTKINQKSETLGYLEDALRNDKRALERDKQRFLHQMDANNSKLANVTGLYKKYESKIENQKQLAENEKQWFASATDESESKLRSCYDIFENFNHILTSQRDKMKQPRDEDLKTVPKKTEVQSDLLPEEQQKVTQNTEEKSPEKNLSCSKSSNSDATEGTLEDERDLKENVQEETKISQEDKAKCLLEVARKENKHLINMYYLLNDRIRALSDQLISTRLTVGKEEGVTRKLSLQSRELEESIELKRKSFVMPYRNFEKELKMKTEMQSKKNEELRELLNTCFSYHAEDSSINREFIKELKQSLESFFEEQNVSGEGEEFVKNKELDEETKESYEVFLNKQNEDEDISKQLQEV